jgi:hypothetical protein
MSSSVAPSFWQGYWQDIFILKQHLQDFLNSNLETIEQELALGQQSLKEIGHRDFAWQKASEFYRDRVGLAYLFDLGYWQMSNQDYIKGTLTIVRTVFSPEAETLDFLLVANLPWSIETLILRLAIKYCPHY